jgi:hypothetical protein
LDGIGIVELVQINLVEIFSLGGNNVPWGAPFPRGKMSLGVLPSLEGPWGTSFPEVMSLGSLPTLGVVTPPEFPLSLEQIFPLLLVTNNYLGAVIPPVTYPFQETLTSLETLLHLGVSTPKKILNREVLICQWEILTREVVLTLWEIHIKGVIFLSLLNIWEDHTVLLVLTHHFL